ncbi:uncharacterized protein LOC122061542 isoform X3 [Macadamia integrifolia]|uniref:uncharacterized protein LOC122061542 isoform X3 n=1 Tax=Macadamia integrifolia TaxID=60698 RepID=UPI001C4E7A5A|nr:uncharacterized protein LOC122061542 isoform X3 [Macadamia integrifolia]
MSSRPSGYLLPCIVCPHTCFPVGLFPSSEESIPNCRRNTDLRFSVEGRFLFAHPVNAYDIPNRWSLLNMDRANKMPNLRSEEKEVLTLLGSRARVVLATHLGFDQYLLRFGLSLASMDPNFMLNIMDLALSQEASQRPSGGGNRASARPSHQPVVLEQEVGSARSDSEARVDSTDDLLAQVTSRKRQREEETSAAQRSDKSGGRGGLLGPSRSSSLEMIGTGASLGPDAVEQEVGVEPTEDLVRHREKGKLAEGTAVTVGEPYVPQYGLTVNQSISDDPEYARVVVLEGSLPRDKAYYKRPTYYKLLGQCFTQLAEGQAMFGEMLVRADQCYSALKECEKKVDEGWSEATRLQEALNAKEKERRDLEHRLAKEENDVHGLQGRNDELHCQNLAAIAKAVEFEEYVKERDLEIHRLRNDLDKEKKRIAMVETARDYDKQQLVMVKARAVESEQAVIRRHKESPQHRTEVALAGVRLYLQGMLRVRDESERRSPGIDLSAFNAEWEKAASLGVVASPPSLVTAPPSSWVANTIPDSTPTLSSSTKDVSVSGATFAKTSSQTIIPDVDPIQPSSESNVPTLPSVEVNVIVHETEGVLPASEPVTNVPASVTDVLTSPFEIVE